MSDSELVGGVTSVYMRINIHSEGSVRESPSKFFISYKASSLDLCDFRLERDISRELKGISLLRH